MRLAGGTARGLAMVAAVTAVMGTAVPAMADPGELDPAFNGGEERVVSYATEIEGATSVVIGPTGKPTLVGSTEDVFTLTRFRLDGSFDPGFSDDGRMTVDIGGLDLANGAAAQGAKVLVVGSSDNRAAIVRVTADGRRDRTFSSDGRRVIDVPGAASSAFEEVADAGDGKAVAVGSMLTGDGDQRALIVRFTATGALDPTFSGDGIRVIDGFKPSRAQDVIVRSDGSLLVLVNDPPARLYRLKAGGAIDTTFGLNGSRRPDLNHVGAALGRVGKKTIMVGPTGGDSIAITRFTVDGALDTTLQDGLSTVIITDTDLFGTDVAVTDVAVVPGGTMVVSGSTFGNLTLWRLTGSARLDADFNSGLGFLEIGGLSPDVMVSVGIDPDGRILAAGTLGGAAPSQADQQLVRVLDQ